MLKKENQIEIKETKKEVIPETKKPEQSPPTSDNVYKIAPGIAQGLFNTLQGSIRRGYSPHNFDYTIIDLCGKKGELLKPGGDAKFRTFDIEMDFLKTNKELGKLGLTIPQFKRNEHDWKEPDLILALGSMKQTGEYLDKIVELGGSHIPIVLLSSVKFKQTTSSAKNHYLKFLAKGPKISSIVTMPNTNGNDPKNGPEILIFNVLNIAPHYFLTDKQVQIKDE